MPSDTIYGLSARALDQAAVEKIHKLKKRDVGKPFIVLISNVEQLGDLQIAVKNQALIDKYWPGALTIILDAPEVPAWLRLGLETLAVRLPDDKFLRELLERVGPIISTSANESGRPEVKDVKQARKVFGECLDFYVDAGPIINSLPSTIIRPEAGEIKILRQGAVKINQKEQ